MFKQGTIVELIRTPKQSEAKNGLKGTIVDGKKVFPDLYKQLNEALRNMSCLDEFDSFVWVMWDKTSDLWLGIADGAYYDYRLTEVGASIPKDNSDRSICFWCSGATVKKDLFNSSYQYCVHCKK